MYLIFITFIILKRVKIFFANLEKTMKICYNVFVINIGKRSFYEGIISKCKRRGGGDSRLTEGGKASFSVILNLFQDLYNRSSDVKKAVGQAVFFNAVAPLLRNLKLIKERSRNKCAMADCLNIRFLSWERMSEGQERVNTKFSLIPAYIHFLINNGDAFVSHFTLYPSLKRKAAFTLAEGATHVETFNNIRRAAFTLAEVLITLGIIGVVAAMTLPSLIAKYQEKVLVTQAKKSYSIIMNAVNTYNSDLGVFGDNSILMDANKSNNEILQEFSKYFNGALLCDNNDISISNKCNLSYKVKSTAPRNDGHGNNDFDRPYLGEAMRLSDGSIISLWRETTTPGDCFYTWESYDKDSDGNYIEKPGGGYETTEHTSSRCGRIRVDTNGPKGPNRIGSDVFTFHVSKSSITFNDTEGNLKYILVNDKINPYTDYSEGEFKK